MLAAAAQGAFVHIRPGSAVGLRDTLNVSLKAASKLRFSNFIYHSAIPFQAFTG
nr:MAG: hypothetical protein [Bacteriophage sp.]